MKPLSHCSSPNMILVIVWFLVPMWAWPAYGENYTLPSNFSVCYRDDPKVASCLKEKIQTILPKLKSGSKEFGLDPLDPIDFVNLNFKFDNYFLGGSMKIPNANISGLSNIKVLSVRPKLDDPKKFALDFEVYLDEMMINMPYTLVGNVQMFDVNMMGRILSHFVGLNLTYTLQGDLKPKDGRDYLHLNDFHWRFKKNEGGIKDYHLLNEDVVHDKPILNTIVKTILRVSWRSLAKSALPNLYPTFDRNLKKTFTNFFLKYPFDVLFPKTKGEKSLKN